MIHLDVHMYLQLPTCISLCVHLGRYDLSDAYLVCNACKTIFDVQICDVVTQGYWPGSASNRSQYIFDEDVFKFFDLFQKNNPGLSQSGFL